MKVIQTVGYKNAGKTTLVCKLVEELARRSFKVGTAKRDDHEFEIDRPGTDTWRHAQAGAQIVAIASAGQTAVIRRGSSTLDRLLEQFAGMDLVLVEGFKTEAYPKLVLLRSEQDAELVQAVERPIAVVAWFPYRHPELPTFRIDDFDAILSFVLEHLRKPEGEGEA